MITVRLACLTAFAVCFGMGGFSISFAREARQEHERFLPLRGEDMLRRLDAISTPELTDLSLSPDGSKLVYMETQVAASAAPNHPRQRPGLLYLMDTMSGHRSLLWEVSKKTDLAEKRLSVKWQRDGRKLGLLLQHEGEVELRTWAIDGSSNVAPSASILPSMPENRGGKIVDWTWSDEPDEIMVVVEMIAPPPVQASLPSMTHRWAWLMSHDRAQMPAWPKSAGTSLLLLNLSTARWKPVGIREIPATGWTLTAGQPSVIASSTDTRLASIDNSKLLWQLQNRDTRVAALGNARNTVSTVNLRSDRWEDLYVGGPGSIGSMIYQPANDTLTVVQAEASLASWPMSARWASLYTSRVSARQTRVVLRELPLDARLYPSDRPGVIYVSTYGGEASKSQPTELKEVNLASGVAVMLAPPDLPATSVDVSVDGRIIAAVLESVNTPPSIHIWSSRTRQWKQLTYFENTDADSDPTATEYLTWRSKDDLCDVSGIVRKPRDFRRGERYPLLVLLQGGKTQGTALWPNSYNPGVGIQAGGPAAVVYGAAGYVVLMPNHRNTVGTGNFSCTRALIGHYGQHVEFDVEAGIDALIGKGWVDPQRIGIIGVSHGSDEVTYAISHSDRYKAAVIVDGPSALHEVILPMIEEGDSMGMRECCGREIHRALMGFDPVEREWADPFKIRTPLLLRWAYWDGTEAGRGVLENLNNSAFMARAGDGRGQTYKLLYALKGNRVPVDVVIDRDEHAWITRVYMLEWQSRLLQWFDYFLMAKGANPIPAMPAKIDYSGAVTRKAARE